jgi:hypothetical protein
MVGVEPLASASDDEVIGLVARALESGAMEDSRQEGRFR